MMLITARLVGYKLVEVKTYEKGNESNQIDRKKLVAFLSVDENNIPLIYDDAKWTLLSLKK